MTAIRLLGDLTPEHSSPSDLDIGGGVPSEELRTHASLEQPDFTVPGDARDLLELAAALLKLEERLVRESGSDGIELEVVVSDRSRWDGVADALGEVLEFALRRRFRVRFTEGRRSSPDGNRSADRYDSVVLFSGGVDSLTGILLAGTTGRRVVGSYVSHVGSLTRTIDRLNRETLVPRTISLWKYRIQRTGEVLHQLRGLAYLTSAFVSSRMCNSSRIEVTECGVTMYQPPILPDDIVTLTTHPTLVRHAYTIASEVLGDLPLVSEPFEDMTKAEIMAWCPSPNSLRLTHSCISSRFANTSVGQCGKCWGCLVKRTSALVAGVPETDWAWDVFLRDIGTAGGRQTGQKITDVVCNNLYLLLDLARKTLEDNLPWWTSSKIEDFGKEDLFRRFALDVYAALHVAYGAQNPIGNNRYAAKAYREAVGHNIVSRDSLDNRVEEVRERKKVPNLDFAV